MGCAAAKKGDTATKPDKNKKTTKDQTKSNSEGA